jgi:predicted dehydrogenase
MAIGCDLNEKNLAKARSHYPALSYTQNAEDIFSDSSIDLVLVATETSTHFELARKALESGKHVLVEKPLASSTEEAKALVKLSQKQGKLLMVDHTFVFAPAVQKMTELATGGELGELLYFDSVRINLGLIQKDVNVLEDLAIHDLSILATLKDLGDIQTVCTHASTHFGSQEENAHLHLTFSDSFQAHIHNSWLSPVKIRQTILAGSKAMLKYDDTEPSEKLRIYDKGIEHDTEKPSPMLPKYRSGDVVIPALQLKETLLIEAEHVIACVQGQEKPKVPGEEGVYILRILERAKESLASNNTPVPF